MNGINAEPSANKYILLDLIGTGGMAEVYRCKLVGRQGFEKLIVLKKLLPETALDSDLVTNFIDEARLAAYLQHDNIAHIYDFGELHGTYYIAMEYLFGKDLHSVMRQARKLDRGFGVEQALFVAAKICDGMDYAHKLKDLQQRPLNIIHRDLTPHNVFLTYNGKVKIIDFGIAKAELYDHRTKVGVVKGKVSYMSPEQLMDDSIDFRSDIFSIGILLYEMISGRRMYSGDTASLIRKCMAVEYTFLEEVVSDLHPDIYAILHKALQRDKHDRYQSCLEMKRDIEECFFRLRIRPDSQMMEGYIRDLFRGAYEKEKGGLARLKDEFTGAGGPDDDDQHERTVIEEVAFDSYIERTEQLYLGPWKGNSRAAVSLQVWADRLAGKVRTGGRKVWALGLGLVLTVMLLSLVSGNRRVVTAPDPDALKAVLPPVARQKGEPQLRDQVKPSAKIVVSEFATNREAIQALLQKAQTSLDATRLTTPAGDSAYHYYSKVLELDPDNNVAADGIRQVGEKYAELAEKSMSAGQLGEAREYIDKGLGVSSQSQRLHQLHGRVEDVRKNEISVLAARAEKAMKSNKLTTPYEESAYRYYRDILKIDGGSRIARAGLVRISDKYAVLGEQAYSKMKFSLARVYVEKGLKVTPRHSRLLSLRKELSGSDPELILRGIERKLGSLFQ